MIVAVHLNGNDTVEVIDPVNPRAARGGVAYTAAMLRSPRSACPLLLLGLLGPSGCGCGGSEAGVDGRPSADAADGSAMDGRLPDAAGPPVLGPLAAFPGATGAGAASVGGRGGVVFVVRTLADAGPGSLRECVEASGPRTCVFAVAGTIELASTLYVGSPLLTVAGHTAPGGGIALTRADGATLSSLVLIEHADVVWRYTRVRNQFSAACTDANGSECGALLSVMGRGVRVIADHNSLSWNQDEAYGLWRGSDTPVHDVTFSHSLVAEGLSSHSTGLIAGAAGSDLSAGVTDIDVHHNLFMNNNHRNPLLKVQSARVVNNVFYNQRFYATQAGGAGTIDVIGNTYLRGPIQPDATFHEIQGFVAPGAGDFGVTGAPSLFVQGNVGWHQPAAAGEQWALVHQVTTENGTEVGAAPLAWQRAAALPAGTHPIVVDAAATVADPSGPTMATVGASRRLDCDGTWVSNRDAVDARLITQYTSNTGISALLTDEGQVGGLPTLEAGAPCTDADADGMPAIWEAVHGLSDADPDDRNQVRAGASGYTNLELFLSGLFPGATPLPS